MGGDGGRRVTAFARREMEGQERWTLVAMSHFRTVMTVGV